MSKSEQSPFDTFIDHRNKFETAEVSVREKPFVIEFVPISLAHFDQFFYDSSARINPAITTTMARHIVSQLEIEAVRSLCELDVKATISTRYVDDLGLETVCVRGYGPRTDHRLSIFADSLKSSGYPDEFVRAGVTVLIGLMGVEPDELLHDAVPDLKNAYVQSQQERIEILADEIESMMHEYRAGILQSGESADDIQKRLTQIDSVRMQIIDPLEFYAHRTDELDTLTDSSRTVIDSRYLDPIGEGIATNAAATYDSSAHTCQFPLNVDVNSLRIYLFHELSHAESPMVVEKGDRKDFGRVKRLGFSILAQSKDRRLSITTHHDLNEGYNDYKARQRARLDPVSWGGSYPGKRAVVGLLFSLTGEKIWDDFYHARSTFDKKHRQEAYRTLSKRLDQIGGKGFINRLSSTWALYGDEHVRDILIRQAYDELTFVKPIDMPAEYQCIARGDSIIIDNMLDTDTYIKLVPVED